MIYWLCFGWGEFGREAHPYCPLAPNADLGTKVAERERGHYGCGYFEVAARTVREAERAGRA